MHLKTEQFQLDPGRGIGMISFGDGVEQIQKTLGLPDETDEPIPEFLLWDYRALKLGIGFLPPDWPSNTTPKQVFRITARHPETTIWEKKLIGLRESEVLAMFRDHGYGSFTVSEEVLGTSKYRSFESEPLNLRLDFRDEVLRIIFLSKP